MADELKNLETGLNSLDEDNLDEVAGGVGSTSPKKMDKGGNYDKDRNNRKGEYRDNGNARGKGQQRANGGARGVRH